MPSQKTAPLLQALEAYKKEGALRLHMPGHKGRFPEDLAAILTAALDVTEVPGLDDLHDPSGPIAGAQALCAELYEADETFFLVGGSTAGLVALMLATAGPGDRVLVPRHAHRSLLTGLVLSGARPVWLAPLYAEAEDLVLGVPASHYRQALAAAPDAKAAWAVSPTYQGVAPDLSEVAAITEAAGLPLLVDEAHGAHFPFDPRLPRPALRQGASAVVQSAHKTLGALTQAAWLHRRGSGVDLQRLRVALRLTQSSSPSYLLMASLDVARRQLATDGRLRLARAVDVALHLRRELLSLRSPWRPVAPPSIPGLPLQVDPTKLWLDVAGTGLSGPEAERALRSVGAQVEMAGPRHVLAMITLADDETVARRFLQGIEAVRLDHSGRRGPTSPQSQEGLERPGSLWLHRPGAVWPEAELSPREASFAPHRTVPLREAVGLLAAESLVPYPPGVPLVMPGERLSEETVELVLSLQAAGIRFQGATDSSLEHILVVA